ncbi:MAG: dTDP-4-dehydrorhamnose reductase [Rhodospirillaceae bacterium]
MSMPAPLLIFGAAGQVGAELCRLSTSGRPVVGLERTAADITDPAVVARAVETHRPAVVVNAAAYTAVDRAESEPAAAMALNRDGPAHLARACAAAGIPLIHLSTDYVFDGEKDGPYLETDPVGPLGVYGRTKLEGERAVQAAWSRHIILRTAWVYSARRSNFVRTMLRLGREREELGVVADQRGCPTAAADIASAILAIAGRLEAGVSDDGFGVFHCCGRGATTWYDFARTIFELAAPLGGPQPRLRAITTADYPTPAQRPRNSVLDTSRLESVYGVTMPAWRDSLAVCLLDLCAEHLCAQRLSGG